jgi:hypothetical protein
MKYRFDQMDASENAFFSRQLEHIRPGLFEVQYPEFKARMFLPINNSIHPGAEEFTYRQFDKVGKAKMIADYGSDLPSADVFAAETSQKIRGFGTSYTYSMQEARAAMMAQLPLDARKANAARHAMEQKLDETLLLGEATANLSGLFTLSGTTSFSPGFGVWEGNTADEIVSDLNGIANAIVNGTSGVETPDTIVLPLTSYNLIASKRMGDGSDVTVLRHFLGVSPYIRSVEWSHRLESNAAWTGKRMVCYRKDPMKLEGLIPQEFEQLAPQFNGFAVKTLCHARCGGVVLYFPKSVAYGDGI